MYGHPLPQPGAARAPPGSAGGLRSRPGSTRRRRCGMPVRGRRPDPPGCGDQTLAWSGNRSRMNSSVTMATSGAPVSDPMSRASNGRPGMRPPGAEVVDRDVRVAADRIHHDHAQDVLAVRHRQRPRETLHQREQQRGAPQRQRHGAVEVGAGRLDEMAERQPPRQCELKTRHPACSSRSNRTVPTNRPPRPRSARRRDAPCAPRGRHSAGRGSPCRRSRRRREVRPRGP